MRTNGYLAAALILASAFGASASSTAQANLPQALKHGGAELELVSCGVRDSLWIDHYAAGLYVPPENDITSVLDPDKPKAVRLKMISMRFVPEAIPEKWLTALQRSLPDEPLARLRRAYRGLDDGDEMTIAYGPSTGLTVQVNGRQVTQVQQHDAIDAILSAWAEDQTVKSKLTALKADHAC